MERYTHRNGEMDHPAVDGLYWYNLNGDWQINWIQNGKWLFGEGVLMVNMPVWGPIPQPNAQPAPQVPDVPVDDSDKFVRLPDWATREHRRLIASAIHRVLFPTQTKR